MNAREFDAKDIVQEEGERECDGVCAPQDENNDVICRQPLLHVTSTAYSSLSLSFSTTTFFPMASPWFAGSVSHAVAHATQRNCVFLVYIRDESAGSQQMDSTLANTDVATILRNETIALRLDRTSEDATMFGQFSNQPSPQYLHDKCSKFIFPSSVISLASSRGGALRDFAPGVLTEQDVIARITRAATSLPPPVSIATTSSSSPVATAVPPLSMQSPTAQAVVAEPSSYALASETTPSSSRSITTFNAETSSTSTSQGGLDEKKERWVNRIVPLVKKLRWLLLKKQLEERRKKREQEEKERERERETRRRADGHALQQAQRDLSEKQNKKLANEYRKEKREADEARRKIREQIALDRADRAARRVAELEERRRAVGGEGEEAWGSSSTTRVV
ncbi:hypothetical protein BC938DRAFT_477730 [Jimgerdemannia flammicorona]|uniref:UBX domain-containing protein n=1 Tax=Jimgerdemannia flammicorona TaxID=994334 RepID=A0A433QNX2_9FUNG|nr:hypothetical protein BC938DRAFT_477730 [Jimgerdemannia flammicorona]